MIIMAFLFNDKINEFKMTIPNLSGILAVLYLIDYKYNKINFRLG